MMILNWKPLWSSGFMHKYFSTVKVKKNIEQSNHFVVKCSTICFSNIGIDMSLAVQHSHELDISERKYWPRNILSGTRITCHQQETVVKWWVNAGPASQTLAQHWVNMPCCLKITRSTKWSNIDFCTAVQTHKAVSAFLQVSRYCLLALQGSVVNHILNQMFGNLLNGVVSGFSAVSTCGSYLHHIVWITKKCI